MVPFTLNEDQMPVVRARINGIEGRFLIDTGDRSSLTLFGPFWRAKGLDRGLGRTTIAMTGYGIGGPIRSIVGRPATFSLGGVPVPAPVTRLSLQKAGVFTSADYAGSIGMGVLKRFVCSFDDGRHRLWLSRSPNFAAADRYDRSGMWVGLDPDGHMILMDVAKDGPAARAGLRPGDRILEWNGEPGDAPHLFPLRELLKDPGVAAAEILVRRADAPLRRKLLLTDLIPPPT
jgi:hypothetical protein